MASTGANGSGIGNEVEAIDWVELNRIVTHNGIQTRAATVFQTRSIELQMYPGGTMKQEAIIALFSELCAFGLNQLIDDVNLETIKYKLPAEFATRGASPKMARFAERMHG